MKDPNIVLRNIPLLMSENVQFVVFEFDIYRVPLTWGSRWFD